MRCSEFAWMTPSPAGRERVVTQRTDFRATAAAVERIPLARQAGYITEVMP
jgi:hypothetical protein